MTSISQSSLYSTCIVGIIGDDVEAVCKQVAREKGIPVLPVHSERGFRGTKRRIQSRVPCFVQTGGARRYCGINPYSINSQRINIGGRRGLSKIIIGGWAWKWYHHDRRWQSE
ncbi:MAG: nitrogenase component 1 [Desulfobacterales bacterium]